MPLAASSLKRYEGMLKKVVEANGKDYDPTKVCKWVDANYPNISTKNSYYSALKHYAKTDDEKKIYSVASEAIRADKDKKETSQTLPEERLKKMLTWKELKEAQVKAVKLYEEGKLDWERFIVICLYTLQDPVRADYAMMEYAADYSKIQPGKNYCVFSNPPKFVFQLYKSAKSLGDKYPNCPQITVAPALAALLRTHWNGGGFGGSRYVYKGTPNSLCHAVARTFDAVAGKPTTIGLIRHARLTEFYEKDHTIGEKEELARKMLHTAVIGERYRIYPVQP